MIKIFEEDIHKEGDRIDTPWSPQRYKRYAKHVQVCCSSSILVRDVDPAFMHGTATGSIPADPDGGPGEVSA